MAFKIANYPAGAFIVVAGQKNAQSFFIIRQGKVRLTEEVVIPGYDPVQILSTGDFFGVVACMSGHPYLETAQAISPSSVIVVHKDEFGILIQKNAPIAMKIIRYFSQKLRLIDRAITQYTTKASEEDPQKLFEVGEYYYNQREFAYASYCYQKYLQYFPTGTYAPQAKARLQSMGAPLEPPPVMKKGLSRFFKAHTMIFAEHEPGNELYIIQKGKVKITKIIEGKEVMLALLKPGDIFGEMALLEDKPRSASAIAYEDVTALGISKSNFEAMVKTQPQLAVKLISILSERIWISYRHLHNLLIPEPIGRIYDMLLTLVYKNKVPIGPKVMYNFEIGVDDLLKMVGFSKEEGEKYIMELLDNKNFRLDQGKIVCLDLQELEKEATFYLKRALQSRSKETSKI